jgi:hypothetical protein
MHHFNAEAGATPFRKKKSALIYDCYSNCAFGRTGHEIFLLEAINSDQDWEKEL